MLVRALNDSWSTCVAAAGGCLFPTRIVAYWECIGFTCTVRFGTNLINEGRAWHNGCVSGEPESEGSQTGCPSEEQ